MRSVGAWKDFIIIGGGFALFIYKLYLSDPQIRHLPIATSDIDSLIPRTIPKVSEKSIASHLSEAGFIPIFRDLEIPATQAYVKEINGVEVEVEFLTHSSVRLNKTRNVSTSGVVAQPLSYLKLSLEHSRSFTTYSSLEGKVVSPGAWIFHKGLTFTKRVNLSKKLKDLYGIWYTTTQLGDFSLESIAEFQELSHSYERWLKTFRTNIEEWISHASPTEWSMLESQDTSGKLKKMHFIKAIREL